MHYIPLACTSSPCNPLFLNLGARCRWLYVSRASYACVQATVGVGTVLIWDFGVAYTRGGGGGVMCVCVRVCARRQVLCRSHVHCQNCPTARPVCVYAHLLATAMHLQAGRVRRVSMRKDVVQLWR